jgi:hypothetical protein
MTSIIMIRARTRSSQPSWRQIDSGREQEHKSIYPDSDFEDIYGDDDLD